MSTPITLPPVAPDLSVFQTKVANMLYTPDWSPAHSLYAITYNGTIADEVQLTPSTIASTTVSAGIPGLPTLVNAPDGAGFNKAMNLYMFVFDGIKRASHRQTAVPTQHPVQAGYNITDHVVLEPATVTLEVMMSDALTLYSLPGFTQMWDGNPSKSVAAFLRMKQLLRDRTVVNVNTRLDTYLNMILTDVSSEESARTYYGGLAMTLSFKQIFVADVSVASNSARLQTTGDTAQGQVQTQTPSQTVTDQHKVYWDTSIDATIQKVPGHGVWNSLLGYLGQAKNPVASPFATYGAVQPLPFKGRTWIRSFR